MDYEADRMKNLVLSDEVVSPERDVVLEERRMRTDSDPSEQLGEALQAALFTQHPYGRPIIGWSHEIESLDRADALAYYDRFYTPENAILVVAGDVDAPEVIRLAEKYYGPIAGPRRTAKTVPPARAGAPRASSGDARRRKSRAAQLQQSIFLVPSYKSAAPGEAEALEVLAHLLGGGHTSLLFKTLVIEDKLAVTAGAHYQGTSVDDTRFYVYAVPAPGVSLERLDAAIDAVIARAAQGVQEADVQRAKTRLVAEAIYAQDNQATLARWYGASLAAGLGLEDVAQWPERIEAVRAADVQNAVRWLDKRRGVTGFLLPAEAEAASATASADKTGIPCALNLSCRARLAGTTAFGKNHDSSYRH